MATEAPAPSGLRSSRPKIALGGRESETFDKGLLSLRIEETVQGIAHCELAVGNWGPVGGTPGFLYFDRRDIDFGKALSITVSEKTVFTGRVTGIEGHFPEGSPPTITLLAEDRLQDLRMARRTRTFVDMTDAKVIEEIAADHGLTADVRLDGPTHRVLAQLNQSDLAFVRDRCRTLDAEVWVDDRKLLVRKRADRTGDVVELGYGNQLREFTVTADLASQATKVTVSGWDVAGKEALKETAATSAVQSEVKDGDTGASILEGAFAARTATVAHHAPVTTTEAKAIAEARFRHQARGFVRARGLAETTPGLRAGRTVRLSNLGKLFDGEYYVTDSLIVFNPMLGLQTEFGAERVAIGRPA
jgi:phage protein D